MRVVSSKIPDAGDIRLPPSISALADLPRGLVLVTGPTGSGKSTSLACLINMVNNRYSHHILTIDSMLDFSRPGPEMSAQRFLSGRTTRLWFTLLLRGMYSRN